MQGCDYIDRSIQAEVNECLASFPAVALLGPRRSGKSTLAHRIVDSGTCVYLDLELPSDRKKLTDPALFFRGHENELVCLDEIQRVPELFPVMRSMIDAGNRNGMFLILGSASRDLIRQSSETLAGRIAYLELAPFSRRETHDVVPNINTYWLRGGFPESLLAPSEKQSIRWRNNFIRTFLERDIPQFGTGIPPSAIERLWQMCAHYHGQLLNLSRLGNALGIRHPTVRSHIDFMEHTFMVRVLPPLKANLKKRLVKSPKVYIRDPGILHALLDLASFDDLLGHPVFGASWEGMVIENVIGLMPQWRPCFYRTAAGAEIDLVMEKHRERIAIECKASTAPEISRGFWNALEDIQPVESWVIAPVEDSYPIREKVNVASLQEALRSLGN